MPADPESLQQRVNELEKENAMLRRQLFSVPEGQTVLVPDEMKPLFDVAQQTVSNYFTDLVMDPTRGTISINDQRYVLIRASALSKDFLDTIRNLYADRGEAEAMSIGKNFLFDIAHTLGMNDAKNFHQKMNLEAPIARLSAGPVHFAFTGWAFVEILPESNPSPDENFYLFYHHPYSFESDSWQRSGTLSDTPVCIMNAGYSSGWCEQSFGIPLTAVEVSCVGKGDPTCTFIMSPPHRIQEHLDRFHLSHQNISKKGRYEIPTFFERKRVEEEMQRSRLLAESSAKAKEDFVANMSHELRTPLSAILGFTELLQKTSLNTEQAEYLEAISSSGSSLLSIINDILDLSKLDAGKIGIENIPFNIPELMRSVQTMFSAKAAAKGLRMSVTVDASLNYSVYGDPMRLTQILVNLLGNSLKFTERGSIDLACRIESENEKEAQICFRLKDTGIGIPAGKLPIIFERFTQADTNITRNYGGTGLGLAISKQLIELLGGIIDVRSEEGVGTEFSFTLWYSKAPAGPPEQVQVSTVLPAFAGSKQVLVVEDNLLNQKLTSIMLRNNGFRFLLAENGSEAIDLVKLHRFDLILMDIQMPVMDGYHATSIIRNELRIGTPIIAMTAHALAGEKEKCIEQGINDYLPKPFTEADLLGKLSAWIKDDLVPVREGSGERSVNLDFLRKQTRNDREVMGEMIGLFCRQNPVDIEALAAAIEQEDYNSIFKKVHALRNSISFFGFDESVGETLLAMETWAREKTNIERILEGFTTVKEYCNEACQTLRTMVL